MIRKYFRFSLKTAFCLLLFSAAVLLSGVCYGENAVLEPQELVFEPVGGGKFIYCNNTEGIFTTSLADSSNPNPRYTMSNLDLTPDRYYIYLSHINYTYGYDEYYQPSGLGFDVELDLEITAKEDSVLKIYRAAFETTKSKRYLDESGRVKYIFPTWGGENAVATMMNHDIYKLNSDVVFKNSGYTTKTINIKKGETVWLSDYVDNYAPCSMVMAVFMTADTELVSGKVDMNVVELRSKDGNLGDRSDFDSSNVAFGSYLRDRCHKGVADTLPEVETDLEYTIDDSVADGAYLPVSFTNQYATDGVTLDSWVSNLNPQDDIWSKYTTVESDMLTLKYYDPDKLNYYGKNVPLSKRDDVWVFDTKHSDAKEYISESGVSQDNYSPNFELDITKDNHGVACSMGNYGVTTRYNLAITNNGTKTRYFNYDATTSANIVVTMKNKDGSLSTEQEQPIVSKGGASAWDNSTTTCAYTSLPPNTTKYFTLEVVLPVNYLGGITNAFRISDAKPSFNIITSNKTMLGDYTTILNTYYDEYNAKANAETKELLQGNLNNFEVTETAYGYMLRFKEWDANPNFQGNFKTLGSDIYFLDKNFSYMGKSHFDSFPLGAKFVDGKFIVKQMDGKRLFSIDGVNWQETFWSETEEDNMDKILVNLNGEYLKFDTDPILLNDRTLVPMRLIFESLGMNVMWDNLTETATAADENTRISFTVNSNTVYVNGKDFTIDTYPILKDDRTLIPLRFLSESLGYRVSWNDIAQTAIIEDYPKLPAHSQKYYVIYKEGYRDNRVEVAFFNVSGSQNPSLVWDYGISLSDNGGVVQDDVKYYFDEAANEWVQFESGYGAISNYATGFIKSNLKADFK